MNKMVLSMVALLGASAAMAATSESGDMSSMNGVSPYISLNAGYGGMSTPGFSVSPESQQQLSAYGVGYNVSNKNKMGFYGRFAAGLDFAQMDNVTFGAELGYAGYKNNKSTFKITSTPVPLWINGQSLDGKFKGYNIDLLGTAKMHLDAQNTVYAKAGAAYVHEKFTQHFSSAQFAELLHSYPDASITKSRVEPELAIGYAYSITPCADVDLGYSYIFGASKGSQKDGINANTPKLKTAPVQALTIGFNYHF